MIVQAADELTRLRLQLAGIPLHQHTRSSGEKVLCDSPYCPPATTMSGTVYDGDGKEFVPRA